MTPLLSSLSLSPWLLVRLPPAVTPPPASSSFHLHLCVSSRFFLRDEKGATAFHHVRPPVPHRAFPDTSLLRTFAFQPARFHTSAALRVFGVSLLHTCAHNLSCRHRPSLRGCQRNEVLKCVIWRWRGAIWTSSRVWPFDLRPSKPCLSMRLTQSVAHERHLQR